MDWDTTQPGMVDQLTTKICQIPGFEKKTASQFASRLVEFKNFLKTLPVDIQQRIINPYLPLPVSKTGVVGGAASGGAKIKIKAIQQRFSGKTLVFTGFRDKNWERIIEVEGGKVGSSISGNTSILVIKDHSFTSGKVTKAKGLGVRVMDMAEFKTEFKL